MQTILVTKLDMICDQDEEATNIRQSGKKNNDSVLLFTSRVMYSFIFVDTLYQSIN